MNKKMFVVSLVLCVIIASCALHIMITSYSDESDSLEKVTLQIKENTLSKKGCTIILKNLTLEDGFMAHLFGLKSELMVIGSKFQLLLRILDVRVWGIY